MLEKWRAGVAKDQRPDGSIRHSQIISTFGPGALVDLVDEAAIVAGLSWWARGPRVVEDRLTYMLKLQEGYEQIELYGPPTAGKDLNDPDRRWIKAFLFPEWFVCQSEKCWLDGGGTHLPDGARPRRLLHVTQLDGEGHKCSGKGKASKAQPTRFTRACKLGHIDDLDWFQLVHRKNPDCTARRLWMHEAGASGDLADVVVRCSGCKHSFPMALAGKRFDEGEPILGHCRGRRPWLGGGHHEECKEPMRLLLRSASHSYFPVAASVIHIPDPDAKLREQVDSIFDLIKSADDVEDLKFFVKKQEPVKRALDGLTLEAVFAELERRKENKPIPRKKVKEAEIEVLQNCPAELATDQSDKQDRFFARTVQLPAKRAPLLGAVDKLVLLPRLTEVRALAGFTRFESKSTDIDGELEIGATVARLDEPLTWLPAVENSGEGFFFSIKESAIVAWEKRVKSREDLFKKGFKRWQGQRPDRKEAKPDFASARFVMLHSLSHLLITAVSLDCGYAASSIRERIYIGPNGNGILLYTASPGAEGSLGGLVEVGRHLERYLAHALDLGQLCSNDPVCSAHLPDIDDGTSDRHLEGASCHGCLLISEPSCERMNVYLDRTLVVPTVETSELAFFREW
jgi:hypothetical protein